MSDKDKLITLIADTLRKQLSIDAPPQRVTRSVSFRKTRSRTTSTYYPVKILFSRKESRDGKEWQVFYVGGDRATPTEITKIEWMGVDYSQNFHYRTYLENTGKSVDDWIFALCYRQTDKGLAFGRATVLCISPTFPQHNWRMENAPADLRYMGGGTWFGVAWNAQFFLDVVVTSQAPATERINGYTTPSQISDWNDLGYDTPLDFVSNTFYSDTWDTNARFCEHSIASATIRYGTTQITRGRQWHALRRTQNLTWFTRTLEFSLPFYVSQDLLKEEFSVSFYPSVLTPIGDKVIYQRQRTGNPLALGQNWIATPDREEALTGDLIYQGTWFKNTIYALVFDSFLLNSGVLGKRSENLKKLTKEGFWVFKIEGTQVKKQEKNRKVRDVFPIRGVDEDNLTIHSLSYHPNQRYAV